MTRSKKIFIGFAIVFVIFLLAVSYDIGRRTTFPGSKPQLKERLKDKYLAPDSSSKRYDEVNSSVKTAIQLRKI